MIDIHSHILPDVDDGAQSERESLEMAEQALEEGIHTIVATPHFKNGHWDNSRRDIEAKVHVLNRFFEENEVPLKVLPGQETRINGDMLADIDNQEVLTINHGQYVFVEFSSDSVPRYTGQLLYDLQLKGYKPIIVHPERNSYLQEKPSVLHDFIQQGAYAQLTAGSLIGSFGKEVKKFSEQLLEAKLIHLIASDAHNVKHRPFHMKEAFERIEKLYGPETREAFLDNARFVVDDEPLFAEPPEHVRKKKRFGLF
ncbi:tyrosine-protein phosphatase [Salimicrobium salexigens]|uniref:Tyrosine-protein phosphatase n=1 Tax=Salimicrobium salexigens TaxID=908941 RepID=A0ABY1KV93_9BACI|nr:CpsB/CapC family capsule biosynthesis tyrosine phosphatase [Salimicrobium salexigens]SIS82635.1 protein-tyrosine phosphatase [Salimicrobium salexigens]